MKFKTQEELYSHLVAGGTIEEKDGTLVKFMDGFLHRKNGDQWIKSIYDFEEGEFRPYREPLEYTTQLTVETCNAFLSIPYDFQGKKVTITVKENR